ncbi:MAG: hypothetical protein ACNS61_07165 [Candidatus Wenzhouxiangella sp. M2_3B_020]
MQEWKGFRPAPRGYRFAALVALTCMLLSTVATGQSRERDPVAALRGIDGSARLDSLADATRAQVPAGRGFDNCLDMSNIDSWDSLDDRSNRVIDLDVGADRTLVGVAWDVGLETFAGSWLSDATVLISDTNGSSDRDAILLSPGFEAEEPGDREFSSGGIVLFAPEGLPEPETGADGILRLQFFELFDDAPNAIDASWRNATDPVICPGLWLEFEEETGPGAPVTGVQRVPAVGSPGTMLLALMMCCCAIVALRRRS